MTRYIHNLSAWLSLVTLLAACKAVKPTAQTATTALECIGVCTLDNGRITWEASAVDKALLGGLSGMDYDDSAKVAYIVSDSHKGEVRQQVRFYTATFRFVQDSLREVHLTNTVTIKHRDGQALNKAVLADKAEPEAVRVIKSNGSLIWSTEAEMNGRFVWIMSPDGKTQESIPYQPMAPNPSHGNQTEPLTFVDAADRTIEGLALSPDRKKGWIAPEEGFIEDTTRVPLAMRITRVDLLSHQPDYEFAYGLHGPIISKPEHKNGISEILATADSTRLLILERAWDEKENKVYASVYQVTLTSSHDILGKAINARPFVQASLVVNLTDYFDKHSFAGLKSLDNVEGMTWGPTLPDGSRSLIFVTDNNFSSHQQTQFIAFKYPFR